MNDGHEFQPTLLEEFTEQLRILCEAEGVSVVVHIEPLTRDGLHLAKAGSRHAPEFLDDDSSWQFLTSQPPAVEGEEETVRRLQGRDEGCAILCLPLARILPRPVPRLIQDAERRAHPVVHNAPKLDGNLWIAVTGGRQLDRLLRLFREFRTGEDDDHERQLANFVSLAARLAWHVYHLTRSLRDPVSRLPGRKEFETFLTRALAASAGNRQSLGLLLINPDDFVMVNHRFGRAEGDRAVREMAVRLLEAVRETDGVFRYGGAVFGVVLPATDLESTRAAAMKYRRILSESTYLDGQLNLEFTIGGVVADLEYLSAAQPDQLEMVQRADNALNQAKLAGGGRLLLQAMSEPTDTLNHFDPLNGIFTTDSEKDYRNMLLLWEAVSLVSSTPEPDQLAGEFVEQLGSRFRPDRLALIRTGRTASFEVVATSTRSERSDDGRAANVPMQLTTAERKLVERSLESGRVERDRDGSAESAAARTMYAVPLIAADKKIGCLFFDGTNRRLQLDSTDLLFINALANQLALALDRAELASDLIREKDRESRKLRAEVRELREVVGASEPIFESRQMVEQMNLIRRVAPSDATVLIIGESGTGKEILAHSVHRYSNRADAPFVTVDCGAIAHSLLEAELFGHVKGAFTGAESASEGRIVQADGGTLFLDEIGELPLGLQTKLLRFVQEREITAVGGSAPRRVDVRIVAATNRDLKNEVALGRFRQDLYYRLQVVSVQAVPLRHRPDDVLPLANAFLERFSHQHHRQIEGFDAAARAKLLSHHWPGNVRELQHTVLRALLLCDGQTIEAGDIQLLPEAEHREEDGRAPRVDDDRTGEIGVASASDEPRTAAATDPGPSPDSDPLMALRSELAWQVQQALTDSARHPVPVGRWLQEDLVLAVGDACDNVVRQAARLAGVPESTFRRQFEKARGEADAGLAVRTETWTVIRDRLPEIVAWGAERSEGDLLEDVRLLLLDVVADATGSNAIGAALMGVTPPTFKRWIRDQAA